MPRAASWVPLVVILFIASVTKVGSAKPGALGPEINPYECLGRYEAATAHRSMAQVRDELSKRVDPPFEPDEPRTVRAMKLCGVALLKARVGDADAGEYYRRAIDENPDEPGYEMFAGNYYSGFRGARRPVLELAEEHYYHALEKLDALRRRDAFRDYHGIVEDWVRRQLLLLYQEDGQPLLPWKAYPQHGSGLDAPGVSVSAQLSVSQDTRDFYGNNEMRAFTQEADFAASDLRARSISRKQVWYLVRAPLRYRIRDWARIRHNYVGAVDLLHEYSRSRKSQITSYYLRTASSSPEGDDLPSDLFADVTVQQIGAGYQRVVPLYPLFDVRLAGSYQRVARRGAVEFEPQRKENFNLYEVKPSVSRFVGSDKVTLDGVYALLDLSDTVGGIPNERFRKVYIRSLRLEYALYSPLVLPFAAHRSAMRGWYFYAGAAEDAKVYGLRTVTQRDYYGGSRFEASGAFDFTLQGTYLTSRTTYADPNQLAPAVLTDPAQTFAGYRTTFVVQWRLVDPDATPGVPASTLGFAADALNIVFPISHDLGVTGRKDNENVRGGIELWLKALGTGIGGTAFLITAGYDYQYFYRIERAVHMGHAALRMGWGDL